MEKQTITIEKMQNLARSLLDLGFTEITTPLFVTERCLLEKMLYDNFNLKLTENVVSFYQPTKKDVREGRARDITPVPDEVLYSIKMFGIVFNFTKGY